MARGVHRSLGVMLLVGLAGCGTHGTTPRSAIRGGCTTTWTGGAGDGNYDNAANWSNHSVPTSGDSACLPPGAFAVARSAPSRPATSLVIEGTLCLRISPSALAKSIINGAPSGQRELPVLSKPSFGSCPPAMLAFDGEPRFSPPAPPATTIPEPAPGRPAASPPEKPRWTIVPLP